jgi:RND family efflux transporter MFP subunit
LPLVAPGAAASVTTASGERVRGTVRRVSPSADARTRNGLAYVDLAAAAALRAGMFVRGEIELGRAPAMTLPRAAVVQREGYAYVYRIEDGKDETRRVARTKVELGRRKDDRIEIVSGLASDARVVAGGVGFLADGDVVRLTSGSGGQ